MSALGDSPPLFDPTAPLLPTGNLRRRAIVSRVMASGATAAALLAVAVLVLVVFDVAKSGGSALSWHFLTSDATANGISDALLGTGLIVLVASVMAMPVGILTALYLVEIARPGSRVARLLTLALDLLQGIPSIVVGLFAYGLVVASTGRESGFACAVAYAVIMLPLVARSSQEVLRLVPGAMREAADALGVDRWRTILSVILPAALSGITTGAILAIARAAGETAPALVCDAISNPGISTNIFKGVQNVPVTIFTLSEQPSPEGLVRAWGAALALLVLILAANIGARVLLARSRRRSATQ